MTPARGRRSILDYFSRLVTSVGVVTFVIAFTAGLFNWNPLGHLVAAFSRSVVLAAFHLVEWYEQPHGFPVGVLYFSAIASAIAAFGLALIVEQDRSPRTALAVLGFNAAGVLVVRVVTLWSHPLRR